MPKIIAWIFFLTLTCSVHAESIINNYDVTINVQTDAKIIVTETINVTSDGMQIKHGIYREIPTEYKTEQGLNYNLGLKIISVKLNGSTEPYHIKEMVNGIRIYIGQADYDLPPGTYTYQITYSVARALGFFKTHDELYWNVTGNAWAFPILSASATVFLPARTTINEATAYTGYQGAKGRDFRIQYPQENQAYFSTTETLPPGNGLTIVTGWPKGIVTAPTAQDKILNFISDNNSLFVAFTGYLILILFYIISWNYLGRDPKPDVIIPLFEPPAGFSPQALGYIKNMQFDHKLFTAAIINMAVKKYLTIEQQTNNKYLLKIISDQDSILTPLEKAICHELFGSSTEMVIEQSNHTEIAAAISQFKMELKKEFCNKYFILNTPIILLGILISLASLLPLVLEQLDMSVPFVIVTLVVCTIMQSYRPSKPVIKNYIFSVFSLILIMVIVAMLLTPMTFDSKNTHAWLMYLAIFLFLTTNSLFSDLMKQPTNLGKNVITKTLGFELFLSATEEDQMNFRNPPDKTPELFERYLPYALALGLEQAWSEQFSKVLTLSQYQPSWYSGNHSSFSTCSFSQSIGTSFCSSIISSSVAPPSSGSGFGGGRGSGGGGGGGGGGGW